MISDAADRASQLTANLLAFARKQPLRPLEIEVNALVEEVVKLLSPTLGRQIEIRTTLSDQVWLALPTPASSRPRSSICDQRTRRHAVRRGAAVHHA